MSIMTTPAHVLLSPHLRCKDGAFSEIPSLCLHVAIKVIIRTIFEKGILKRTSLIFYRSTVYYYQKLCAQNETKILSAHFLPPSPHALFRGDLYSLGRRRGGISSYLQKFFTQNFCKKAHRSLEQYTQYGISLHPPTILLLLPTLLFGGKILYFPSFLLFGLLGQNCS